MIISAVLIKIFKIMVLLPEVVVNAVAGANHMRELSLPFIPATDNTSLIHVRMKGFVRHS